MPLVAFLEQLMHRYIAASFRFQYTSCVISSRIKRGGRQKTHQHWAHVRDQSHAKEGQHENLIRARVRPVARGASH